VRKSRTYRRPGKWVSEIGSLLEGRGLHSEVEGHEGRGLTVGLRTIVSAAFLVYLAAVRVHKVRLAELGWRHVRRGEGWAHDKGTWAAAAGVVVGCDAACVEFIIGCCFGLECDLLQCVGGIRGFESVDNGQNGGG
jgi:hypothetical protein